MEGEIDSKEGVEEEEEEEEEDNNLYSNRSRVTGAREAAALVRTCEGKISKVSARSQTAHLERLFKRSDCNRVSSSRTRPPPDSPHTDNTHPQTTPPMTSDLSLCHDPIMMMYSKLIISMLTREGLAVRPVLPLFIAFLPESCDHVITQSLHSQTTGGKLVTEAAAVELAASAQFSEG
ncbi:unnamed protein product [Pleuronectes platessa]|uniref:Uncharacterized protein n=1 Tax=Pleuronectes platessa TaxID=8262 RepID=A0A9N7UFU7_PLEPL|nr:unnamed protein product [Pleuronectes platessa]